MSWAHAAPGMAKQAAMLAQALTPAHAAAAGRGTRAQSPAGRSGDQRSGGPGQPSDYFELLEVLAGIGRPVVTYDQIGFERSDCPADPALWTICSSKSGSLPGDRSDRPSRGIAVHRRCVVVRAGTRRSPLGASLSRGLAVNRL